MLANELSCAQRQAYTHSLAHADTHTQVHSKRKRETEREGKRGKQVKESKRASFCLSVVVVVSNFNFILLQRTNCAPTALLSVCLRLCLSLSPSLSLSPFEPLP